MLHSRFPCLSETFIFAQAESLEALGVPLWHVANHRPRPDEVHPPMRAIVPRVCYLQDLPWLVWAKAHRWAIQVWGKHYWRTLRAVAESEAPWPQRLAQWAGAVAVLYLLRGRQVRLHAHFTYGAAAVAYWCRRLAGIPYTLTLHGSDVLYDNPPDLAAKIAEADGLVSISQKNFIELDARFPGRVPANRAVIPLGVIPQPYQPPPPLAQPLLLLNVGRLSEHKAQHILIAACARLKAAGIPFVCDIIGEGERRAALTAQIAREGLTDAVRLLGPRYHDEILASYRHYHVFVLTSVVEGMPLVLMEAMNAGLPIITTTVGAIAELVGETALLVPPESPQAVADAIVRVVRGEVDLARLTAAAHERLHTHFDLRHNHARFAQWLAQQDAIRVPDGKI